MPFLSSVGQCQLANCTGPDFGKFESDADIAGEGVVVSFIITLSLTITLTFVVLVLQAGEHLKWWEVSTTTEKDENGVLDTSHWRRIFDGLLVGLSDTQIITALALMIVTGVRTSCTISAYHYNLVCQLVLMSTMVHFCSMTVIEHYFYNKFLAAVRILFITVNFIFGFFFFARRAASDSFPVGIPSNEFKTNRTSMVIAADCFMDNTTAPYLPNDGSKSYLGIIQYGLLFAFFIAATMLSLVHTHMFNKDKPFKAKHWTYWARGLMSVAALGVSIWIICYLTSFRNSMRDSGWFGGDDGEYSWDSFGQLVPLILLILPLLQFVESATNLWDGNKGK